MAKPIVVRVVRMDILKGQAAVTQAAVVIPNLVPPFPNV